MWVDRRTGTLRAVTHGAGHQVESTIHHGPPTLVVLLAVAFVLILLAMSLFLARSAIGARRRLRTCPVCLGDAIREHVTLSINVIEVWTWLQCGQCGTWRRMQTCRSSEHAHGRRVQRDRDRIRALVRQLEAERRVHDVHAFIRLLHTEIVSADDFLAGTRPPASRRRRPDRQPDR
jgi:hypothetical protein